MEKTEHTSDTYNPVDEAVAQPGHIDPALFIDPKVEKKLVRRIDTYVISIMGVSYQYRTSYHKLTRKLLYLMCFLDRSNIGAANVANPSISQALNMSPSEYGAVVSVVYAT